MMRTIKTYTKKGRPFILRLPGPSVIGTLETELRAIVNTMDAQSA